MQKQSSLHHKVSLHAYLLLAPPGAGKSTLIKMVTGETKADKGTVWRHPNLRMAYVAQVSKQQQLKQLKQQQLWLTTVLLQASVQLQPLCTMPECIQQTSVVLDTPRSQKACSLLAFSYVAVLLPCNVC